MLAKRDTTAVKLTVTATIARIAFAKDATVALPPATAQWLMEQGSVKSVNLPKKRRTKTIKNRLTIEMNHKKAAEMQLFLLLK